jgi:uncharacterized protein
MGRPIILGIKPFPMFLFTSFTVIIIGFLFQLVAMFLAAVVFRVPLMELLDLGAMDSQSIINAVKFIQIFGGIGTFIFSSVLLSFLYTGDWLAYFNTRHFPGVAPIIILFAIVITGLPFVNYLTELNMQMVVPIEKLETLLRSMEEQTEAMMMKLITVDNLGGLMLNLVMIAVIPAVGEELLFRGLIQRHLGESFKNVHLAIIVTAVIFSLVHMQIYSFLPRFFLGIVLGYLLFIGRSIWYPIMAHFINNALGVIFYYLANKEKAGESLEEIGTSESMPLMAIISLIAVAGFMMILVKMIPRLQSAHPEKD